MTEAPAYRVIGAEFSSAPAGRLGRLTWSRGKRLTSYGWPTEELEPQNETAEKIFAYWQRHRFTRGFPDSPLGVGGFGIYLPACFVSAEEAKERGSVLGGVVEHQEGRPLYKMLKHQRFAAEFVGRPGETVCYLGWPCLPTMEPANDSAWAILAYLRENAANPALLLAPWCEFEGALELPELPETPKPKARPRRKFNNFGRDFARYPGDQEPVEPVRRDPSTILPAWALPKPPRGASGYSQVHSIDDETEVVVVVDPPAPKRRGRPRGAGRRVVA